MPLVLQLTDSHLIRRAPVIPPVEFADAVHLLTGRTTNEAANSVCNAVQESEPPFDLVIHTGDIADEHCADGYADARALLERFDAPLLVTPGNHDEPELVLGAFGSQAALTAGHIDVGGWRVIVLSSFDNGQQRGTFSDTTLAQLDQLLRFDGPVLIGTHHPPLTLCSHPDCINTRSAEFLSIIDGHSNVVAVVAGHLHLDDEVVRRGVRHLVTPSTALQLQHRHPLDKHNTEATLGAARVLDLRHDGTAATHLVWA